MQQFVNSKGIVLVTLLLFMQILAFIGLYLLESSLLAQKIAHGVFAQQVTADIAEEILKKIEAQTIKNVDNCSIEVINSKDLLVKSLDWWQAHACSGQLGYYNYYYVVEPLGQDSCAKIKDSTGQIADYFRLTLNLFEKSFATREVLQSTIIKPHNADIPCDAHLHEVMIGRQAWCQIN